MKYYAIIIKFNHQKKDWDWLFNKTCKTLTGAEIRVLEEFKKKEYNDACIALVQRTTKRGEGRKLREYFKTGEKIAKNI